MNDVAVIEQKELEEITETKILEYLDSAGITNNLLANEKKLFYNIAREFHLNPFKREIHITAYGSGDNRKCSIITGYEVYIKRAERTGKLDGWSVTTEGAGDNLKAIVTIYRKDMKYPFIHEAYYPECVQRTREGKPNAIWSKMPRFMTKKVAIGQAFRLCFSDDLGGMPYEEAECPQEERNVTEHEKDLKQAEEITEKELNRHIDEMVGDIDKALSAESLNFSNEALRHREPLEGEDDRKGNVHHEPTQQELIDKIKSIVFYQNPESWCYFKLNERDMEQAIVKGAENIQALKNQYERLHKELANRIAAYEAEHTTNETPAMYTEQEAVPYTDEIDTF